MSHKTCLRVELDCTLLGFGDTHVGCVYFFEIILVKSTFTKEGML